MNIVFPAQGPITHKTWKTNGAGGVTWCGIPFYWGPGDEVVQPDDAECDCMACISRPGQEITFSSYQRVGVSVINPRAISKLDFISYDKEPK